VFLGILLLVLGGCAGKRAFQKGEKMARQGNYEAAAAQYADAARQNPEKHEYRTKLQLAREDAARARLAQGRLYREQGRYRWAAAEFKAARELDPTLEVAGQELERAGEILQAEEFVAEARDFVKTRRFAQAKHALDKALSLNPENAEAKVLLEQMRQERKTVIDDFELEVASDKPITLKFQNADIREVFNILSRLSGINFIFDEGVRPQKVSVFLEDATFAQALELLLNLNQLDKRILNAKTIIIYPDTREKKKQFEDQVIQTFYLSNIDAKKAVNLLRTMLQLRKIYVHEELNAIVVRDTPDVIRLASQILEAADRADSEVVFDLELVEVSHGNDLNFGPELSSYAVSAGLGKSGTIVNETLGPGSNTSNLVESFNTLESFYTLPTATFDFAKTLIDSEVLANPKIRVKNKEKAKVHIGTREPVITVTTTGETSTDNIQYVDVGVKLDVEPTIQLDNTIVTKLSLEVSSVSDRQETANGSLALTITTTNAQSVLALKDGEQTVIGGLIRDSDSKTRKTIPLLGDLPIIGDLLSSFTKNKQKREILLSITPHIVKSLDLPRADVASIWSGGEDDLKAGPNFGAFAEEFSDEIKEKHPQPVAPGIEDVVPEAPPAAMEPNPSSLQPVEPAEKQESAAGMPLEEKGKESAGIPAAPAVPAETAATAEAPVQTVKLSPQEVPAPSTGRVFVEGPMLVNKGDNFALEVSVDEVANLYSAPLFVNYDPAKLEFNRAEEGEFLRQGGQVTVFTTSNNPQTGQVIVGYKQGASGKGATGGGNLFRLYFTARSEGLAPVRLERLNFRDPEGNRLPLEAEEISVEVR